MKTRLIGFAAALLQGISLLAQEAPKPGQPAEKYDRKEEIIYDNKRYRRYNNYLTAGGGFDYSSNRSSLQKAIAADFQFHIRRQNFQIGGLMSGEEFLSNNHVQAHLCYGFRRETKGSNLAIFAGPTYFTGVEGAVGSPAIFYSGFGGYACVQAVTKVTFDIGFGAELFGEVSYRVNMAGIKFIVFFSGAYRGNKYRYSPNPNFQNP